MEGLDAEQLAAIKSAFDRYDQDKNNYIDLTELANLALDLGEQLEGDELQEAYAVLDANSNGRVTFDEFIAWWQAD